MLERIEKYYSGTACDFDVVLLIDDADCRFQAPDKDAAAWVEKHGALVRKAAARPELRFLALFASPEIETWLLADWEQSFGEEYRTIVGDLLAHLAAGILGPQPWTTLEDYGGGYEEERKSCRRKLSDDLNSVLAQLATQAAQVGRDVPQGLYTYSKKTNGPRMLQRIRPTEVAKLCATHFEPVYLELRALANAAPEEKAEAPTPRREEKRASPSGRIRPKPRGHGSRK